MGKKKKKKKKKITAKLAEFQKPSISPLATSQTSIESDHSETEFIISNLKKIGILIAIFFIIFCLIFVFDLKYQILDLLAQKSFELIF